MIVFSLKSQIIAIWPLCIKAPYFKSMYSLSSTSKIVIYNHLESLVSCC